MTVDAFSFALDDCPDVTSTRDAFLLVALGNNADAYGLCYPRQSTLMEKTRMGERAVREGLKSLEALGMILRLPRRRRDGSRKSDAYLLIGWPLKTAERRRGRLALAESDGHPLLEELGLTVADLDALVAAREGEQDENANRQEMPVASTGSRCRTNRHLTPDQPAADAGIHDEPSLEPSEEPLPPLPPGAGGMGSDRLEGFDLFLSVWPRNWPGVDDAPGKLRSLWRRAVDQHGPDAVLASARNYLAKMQATPTASKSSVGWFLQKRSGMLAKFIPAGTPAVPLGPLELGNSPQHEFLKAARKAGMPDGALRRWAREDAFVVVPWGEIPGSAANKAIGVDGDVDGFKAAFQDLADQHRMVIWPMTFLRAQQNKQQQRRAG